jgi:hypothetical protein
VLFIIDQNQYNTIQSINQINQLLFGMRIAPWSVAVHNTHESPGVTENYLFERVTRDMTVAEQSVHYLNRVVFYPPRTVDDLCNLYSRCVCSPVRALRRGCPQSLTVVLYAVLQLKLQVATRHVF